MTAGAVRRRAAALAALAAACAAGAPRASPGSAAPRPGEPSPVLQAPGPGAPSAEGGYGPEPAASPAPFEDEILRRVAGRLGGGRHPARTSPALVLAARELAARAAAGDAAALAPTRLRGALARALSFDAAPAAYLVSAPRAEVADALLAILPAGGATHLGAGAVERDGIAHVVLLTAERRVRLASFPREVAPGARAVLAGELAADLRLPRVYLLASDGRVTEAQVSGGRQFRAALAFPLAGRATVEVVAGGPAGPEVAALLTVSVGGASLDPPDLPAEPDPADPAEAEALVVAAIDALRRAHGLGPLEPAPELREVARRHSAEMLTRSTLAHVLPGSGDLPDRLRRAGVSYRAALENVAKGRTARAAHAVATESPAHRDNMLSPIVERVGVGIASGRLASGAPVVYLTEIFVQPPDDGASSPLTPEARVREALWRERARRGAPPLLSDPLLDDLARQAAAEMRRRDRPGTGDLAARVLEMGRALSAADAFVASHPAEAAASANLPDRRFRRVGVGVSTGPSGRFGAGR
ncbi:MAG TPA: CAP domain-containing protein, partial [Anaeromyxobacteraceae bacterium]|nr:CAP domain-containing protein [Anaeromyxobacteraceae bacterium]